MTLWETDILKLMPYCLFYCLVKAIFCVLNVLNVYLLYIILVVNFSLILFKIHFIITVYSSERLKLIKYKSDLNRILDSEQSRKVSTIENEYGCIKWSES